MRFFWQRKEELIPELWAQELLIASRIGPMEKLWELGLLPIVAKIRQDCRQRTGYEIILPIGWLADPGAWDPTDLLHALEFRR